MTYQQLLRWSLENMDKVPAAVQHAREVWSAIQTGTPAQAARESGEFLLWLSGALENLPEYAGAEEVLSIQVVAPLEEAGIGLGDLLSLWTLISLLLPYLRP